VKFPLAAKSSSGSVALFVGKKAVEKPLRGKVQQRDFPTPLGNPARAAGFRTFSTASTTANLLVQWSRYKNS
jgi:hypothetical protein